MIVLIPDHCLSIYFTSMTGRNSRSQYLFYKQEFEIRFISVAVKTHAQICMPDFKAQNQVCLSSCGCFIEATNQKRHITSVWWLLCAHI